MTELDKMTERKSDIIEKAQDLAETELSGDKRYTDISLWDDGDFKVEVVHGFHGYLEKVVWRSNESDIYPGEQFVYMVETVDCPNVETIVKKEVITQDTSNE